MKILTIVFDSWTDTLIIMARNKLLKIVFSLIICVIFIATFSINSVLAANVSNLVNFNNTSDLENLFNPSTGHTFTNIGASGISNSGSINVPEGSGDIWTTKQGYSVSGTGDKYTFSAFFKNKGSNGYGGLGYSNVDTNETVEIDLPNWAFNTIAPAKGIGVIFHGGGGYFVNNASVSQTLDWYESIGDLIVGNWYKMIFVVTAKGSNTYDLDLQIWNSDVDGNVGTQFTHQTQNDVVNADMGSASTIHGYFSADANRMEKIDNFVIQLEGGSSFIEEDTPVVLTDSVSNISNNSATTGGNVTDEQGAIVTARGVCWSTSPSPTTGGGTCTNNGSGLGQYESSLTSLVADTIYYVRAYATNSAGTSYGSENTFVATSSSSGSSSNNSNSTPACNDIKPVSAPDLFQIDSAKNSAKLFFTPISNTNQFYVSFSTKANAEEHGELVSLLREGVQSETIYFLNPNTTYYFKVRGQNGCMPGEWSNTMKVKTNANGQITPKKFYRYTNIAKVNK